MRLYIIATILLLGSLIHAQEKKKWDVNKPEGIPYRDVTFAVNEGTWLNVDVSPDGRTLAFDLLGDIYTLPIEGGDAACIRSGIAWEVQPRFSPDGKQILFTSDAGGGDNIWVMNADGSSARQVTKESFRLLNNAVWMPDGNYFVARKHFTATRSLGAGEIWLYHISGGEGLQLTKRKNDQQDVNEPSVSPDGRYVYFSEDLYPGGYFQYNKNPNQQIFGIRRYDRVEGKVEDVTGGSGGACRPQVSRDGQWLAFVRRVGVKTCLFVRNLNSGEEWPVYDRLDKDQQEAWTIFGCYPGFAWLPDDMGIVIWAGGKLRRIALKDKSDGPIRTFYATDGQALSTGYAVTEIPFVCRVRAKVAETLRSPQKVFEEEFTARAIRHARTSPDGRALVFNAAGKLYAKALPDGAPQLLNANARGEYADMDRLEFEPAFSPDGRWLCFVSWHDEQMGAIWVRDNQSGAIRRITKEKGIYRTPQFSPDGKMLVFRKQGGDDELGFAHTQKPGIYIANTDDGAIRFVVNEGENPQFSPDGSRILVNTGGYLFGALDKSLVSFDLNGKDKRVVAKSKYANQWVPSPDGQWLAFTELHKVYVCAFPASGQTLDLSADMKSVPVTLMSRDAGYNLHWSVDSRELYYTLGDEYFAINLQNRFAFMPGAPDSLPALDTAGRKIGLRLKADKPSGKIILRNARILTMEGDEIIANGEVETTDNRISYVGPTRKTNEGRVIDCKGKTIMPGIIDVHAHPGNFRYGLNPQKQWEYWANLAYGVTTMHDPSVNSEMAFSNAEMLKSGRMIGPRLFSTGTILYGADGDFKAPINSLDDARAALRRTKAWGAFSVKSYNQPRRDQRQQVIAAARELDMLVVPEGGSFFYHNVNQMVDGHTGVEHNLPVAPLYQDVINLWKNTKTHNTPTLIVNYGGLNGEYYWYQHTDVWKKQRLLRFTPRHIVDSRSRHVTKAPEEEYENGHILVSRSCKKLQDAGVNINLGAHGQLNGLGAHWELWMLAQGGMSNMQALRCATINGAVYLGMDAEIGSIKTGKLADLIVLDADPLDNIRNSELVRYVMVNGRLYEAETLQEVGDAKPRGKFWFEMPGSGIIGNMMGQTCQQSGCVCGH
ncbi:MAG: amidohydrolase family protein [Saprospiraceae bacterium]